MAEVITSTPRKVFAKWYQHWKFPLIPIIEIKHESGYNTRGIVFTWLFFKFWTLDHLCLEVSLVCSAHWGLGIIGLLPYLRWCVAIPLPKQIYKVECFFTRKSKAERNDR